MADRCVLITGAGGPGYPLIYKALRSSDRFHYRIVGGELNPLAGNLYASNWLDAVYQLPRNDSAGYFDAVCEIIRKERVTYWLSGVDEELPLIAGRRADLAALGCKVTLPPAAALEASFDKLETQRLLNGKVPFPQTDVTTCRDLEAMHRSLGGGKIVIKATRGRGNRDNFRASTVREIEHIVADLRQRNVPHLCQRFIPGEEFNVSLMLDAKAHPLYAICRQKIDPPRTRPNTFAGLVRRDAKLEALAIDAALAVGLYPGASNVEIIRDKASDTYVIDVNGGRWAAQDRNLTALGVNIPEMLIDMAEVLEVKPPDLSKLKDGVVTIKFIDEYVTTLDEIEKRCTGFALNVE